MALKETRRSVSGDTNASVLNERLRVAAIIESAEGKRNPTVATELALRSSLDVEAARAILATLPPANPYLAAMDREGPVGLTAATADFTNDPKAARLKELTESVAAFNSEQGYTNKPKG